ncbi:2-C-methyl-D-erythritol 4-phosphate cytidylyltransferase [uncultured Acidaminococcus sp.]|uniref:2-C-methyl-D-erythritol 4-phosphate cytidylyltransferase n=1 Tax=uncultured Acidaminococcus sp. TaxID=352152 RepID=UPI0026703A0F|nr:2-C-methyl-D-erythritol 4-phosphate cytidylyltransferase [uncultured Acidaminococcus sp.]
MEKDLVCIIAAAGMGKRLGLGYNKNYASVRGIPILVRNLHQLSQVPGLTLALVTVAKGEETGARQLLQEWQDRQFPGLAWQVVTGGKERQDSVAHALAALPEDASWVAVHDGARPFAGPELFQRVWDKAREMGAAIAAVPCKDTIKVDDCAGSVDHTLDRSRLWAVQTPQIFRPELLREGFALARERRLDVTDDASLVEALGGQVALIMGDYDNRKITTPEDLAWAQDLAERREGKPMEFRIGSGYDVHRLVEGRPLILCGVTVPWDKGLDGHSDADVPLHALMDALLGAAGLGDIGRLFPDTDDAYLGADSRKLLAAVLEKLRAAGWQVNNVDVTIIAQRPKLAPYEPAMLENLMADLGLPRDAVNVKATTTEKLGFTGRGEGIAAEAVASLTR